MSRRLRTPLRLALLLLAAGGFGSVLTAPSCGGGSQGAAVDDGTEVGESTWYATGFTYRNRMGRKSGQSHDLGLRFQVPDLVQGQAVAYARLILPATGDGVVNGTLPLDIVGLDVDDVAEFTSTRPSQNPITVASTPWTITENWPGFTKSQIYSCVPLRRYSPDVSAIVNEVLARPGWGAGSEKTIGIVVRDANPPGAGDNFVTAQDRSGYSGCENDHSARLEVFLTPRDAFVGKELLGRVSDTSATVNAASLLPVDVYFEYGTTSGTWTQQTPAVSYVSPSPTDPAVIEVVIGGLQPDTRYFYRMRYRPTGEPIFEEGPTRTFHTQRPPESTFRFAVQTDSHLQNYIESNNTEAFELYGTAMLNLFGDLPDFLIDLGDTFHTEFVQGRNAADAEEARHRYLDQRIFLDQLTHSVPLYLVPGNHEGEFGWELDGTPDNLAVWGTQARKLYYPNPAPDAFFMGDPTVYPFVGQREAVWAFEWGDALFVGLDPYWSTLEKPHDIGSPATGDRWDWSLGATQYFWLQFVLATSPARWKFVFAHQVTGGVTDYGRGGIKAARHAIGGSGSYEWGGENADGSYAFDERRPGWPMPVHDLLASQDVTVFFHGHDHVFVTEELDHVVYQAVPQPSNPSYNKGFPENANNYVGDRVANSGHLRVKVEPTRVKVEYVRAFLPGDGNNQSVAASFAVYDCNRNGIRDEKEGLTCECQDGIDNDGDGLVDHPADVGCDLPEDLSESTPILVCDNGLDDDGDTLVDFPADPGCANAVDASELSVALACDNGLDDDGDGAADFPDDSGCDGASDANERSPAIACDNGVDDADADTLADFPADPECLSPADRSEGPDCSDGLDNDGDGLADHPSDPGCSNALDLSERGSHVCDNGSDDDGDGLADVPLDPGCGDVLDTSERSSFAVCDNGTDDDGDGPVDFPADPECNSLADLSEQPDCGDGADNDGDGLLDHPEDLGCASPADIEETSSAECDNGVDDDGDGLVDHAEDSGCNFPLDPQETNPEYACDNGFDDDGDLLADFPDDPDCIGATDASEQPDCADDLDNDGDGAIDYPADPSCSAPSDRTETADCGDGIDNDGDSAIDHPADAGCTGAADLTEVADCSDGVDNDGDGATDHPADIGCSSAGDLSETSNLLVCDNGVDDDADTLTDFAEDPGCASPTDASERSVLTCDNGIDDDGDTLKDYPLDPQCISASDLSEIADCEDGLDNDGDFLVDSADPQCWGDYDLSEQADCDDNIDNDGDWAVDFPEDPGCHAAADAYEHASALVCDNGGDDDGDGSEDFPEDPGCDDPVDADERSPALVCDDGEDDDEDGPADFPADAGCNTSLDASEELDCADGLDNDSDGETDFPADTQCLGPTDPTERPDCVDGLDNDGDGLSDSPQDPGCASASDVSERSVLLVCDNGFDDDLDGSADFPLDPGCVNPTDVNERGTLACDDALDNDFDLLIDFPLDPHCSGPADPSELSDCIDGLDNDADGRIDWSAGMSGDPGCVNASDASELQTGLPCDDGVDNDADGRVDYDPLTIADAPAYAAGSGDPGCGSPSWLMENPQCQDGLHNDADGRIDFDGGLSVLGAGHPNLTLPDAGCTVPWKNREKPACGLGFEIALALPLLTALRRRAVRG